MTRYRFAALAVCLLGATGIASAQSFEDNLKPLVRESCVRCHGVRTVTPLNLVGLGYDLSDHGTLKTREKVYERLARGEMPPTTAPQPDAAVVDTALTSLKRALVDANLAARGEQRTPLRRLTRLEYGYTVSDLLHLDEAVGTELARGLPAEPYHIDYAKSPYLYGISRAKALGVEIVKQLDDAYVAFFDFGSTYTFHSLQEGFGVPYPGRYRVSIEAYPYQADTPVGLMVYKGRLPGVAVSLDELIGSFEFVGDALHAPWRAHRCLAGRSRFPGGYPFRHVPAGRPVRRLFRDPEDVSG